MLAARDRPGRRALRRWLRRLGWLGLGTLTALVVAYFLRERLLTPLIVRHVAARAREELGAELTIARISGNWYREVVLHGVRWRSSRPPLLRVDEVEVEVRLSLPALLRGDQPWLERVAVRGRGVELRASGAGGPTSARGPLDLEVPDLELAIDGLELTGVVPWTVRVASVRAGGRLAGGELAIDELAMTEGANHAVLRNARVPLSPTSPGELLRAASGQLSLALPEARTLTSADTRPWPVQSADLSLALSDGQLALGGRVDLDGGSLEIERGELALPEQGPLVDAVLDVALQADFADLAPLGALLGRELAGRWLGEVDIHGTLRVPTGHFVGRGEALEVAGVAIDGVQVDVQTDGQHVRLERCIAHGAGLELTAEGELVLEPLELVDVAIEGRTSAPALLERLPFACRELSGRAFVSGPPRAPHGTFEVAAQGAGFRGVELTKAEAAGRIEGTRLVVERLELGAEDARLRATASVEREGESFAVELTELEVAWREQEAELVDPVRIVLANGRVALDGLVLDTGSGRAALTLDAGKDSTHGRLTLGHLDVHALASELLPPGPAITTIDGHVEGRFANGEWTLAAELEAEGVHTHVDGPEWRLDVGGSLGGGRLDIARFVARSESGEHLDGRLSMPFDPRQPRALSPGDVTLVLAAEIEDLAALPATLGGPFVATAGGRAQAQLDLAGSWSSLVGSAKVSGAELVLPGDGAALGPCVVDLELDATPDSVLVKHGELTFAQGSMRAEGTLQAPLDVTGLAAEPPRLPRDAGVRAQLTLDLPDVAGFAELSRGVRRAGGRVTGQLDVSGALSEPELHGRVSWTDGELRLASDFPALTDIAAELAFDGRRLSVESLYAEFGGAPVRLTGTVDLAGKNPVFDLELAGRDLLLARSKRLRLRADANLALKGSLQRPRVSGELVITDGRFVGDIDLIEKLLHAGRAAAGSLGIGSIGPLTPNSKRISFWNEPPLALTELDVHVRGSRFDVETNLLKARLRPDLQLLGTGAVPTCEGPVYVDEATLGLPSATLELSSGVLQFRQTDPFRPDAALTATARIQGYDVRVAITGSPDELESVDLSSSPPLAPDDLWVLTLTGQPPVDPWRDQSSQAMESVAVFLAKDRLAQWFAGDSDAASLLDRIEIEVGARTSYSGQPTGRARLYLNKRSPHSGRATYLSAEVDVYDRINFGLGLMFRPR